MTLNYAFYLYLFESICNSPLGQKNDLHKMVTGLLHIMWRINQQKTNHQRLVYKLKNYVPVIRHDPKRSFSHFSLGPFLVEWTTERNALTTYIYILDSEY